MTKMHSSAACHYLGCYHINDTWKSMAATTRRSPQTTIPDVPEFAGLLVSDPNPSIHPPRRWKSRRRVKSHHHGAHRRNHPDTSTSTKLVSQPLIQGSFPHALCTLRHHPTPHAHRYHTMQSACVASAVGSQRLCSLVGADASRPNVDDGRISPDVLCAINGQKEHVSGGQQPTSHRHRRTVT